MPPFIHTVSTMHNLSFFSMNLSFRDFCLANCDFDNSTICNYQNGAGQFNWTVQRGSTPSLSTGPTSDVSGTGKLFILL